MRSFRTGWLAMTLAAGCGLDVPPFACQTDSDCGPGGVCEAEGGCSVADVNCPTSQRRFVNGSRPDLSGGCVQACISAIGAGGGSSCAVKADGTALCWGDNQAGQLGWGTTDTARHPGPVGTVLLPAGRAALDIDISQDHACATVAEVDGVQRLYCWGFNNTQQILPPRSNPILTPRQLLPVTGPSVANNYTCGLTPAGRVVCWGINMDGQVGADLPDDFLPPRDVVDETGTPLAGMTTVTSVYPYACAASATEAWCWGRNELGQLGDGSTTPTRHATRVQLPPGTIAAIDLGLSFGCAAVAGELLCWGSSEYGVLGRDPAGVPLGYDPTPRPMDSETAAIPDVVQLAGSKYSMCARTAAGDVYCWGLNTARQLGAGTVVDHSWMPVKVVGLEGVIDLAGGIDHTCALTDTGRMYCWGGNERGELGRDVTSPSANLVRVPIVCSPEP